MHANGGTFTLNHDLSAKQRFDFPVQPDSVPTKCHSLASAPLVPR